MGLCIVSDPYVLPLAVLYLNLLRVQYSAFLCSAAGFSVQVPEKGAHQVVRKELSSLQQLIGS